MNRTYVLVTWDNGVPLVRNYNDEHDAIETLKDARPIRDAAHLFRIDHNGTATRIEGW